MTGMIASSSFGVRVWGVGGIVQVQKGLMERKGRFWILEGGVKEEKRSVVLCAGSTRRVSGLRTSRATT